MKANILYLAMGASASATCIQPTATVTVTASALSSFQAPYVNSTAPSTSAAAITTSKRSSSTVDASFAPWSQAASLQSQQVSTVVPLATTFSSTPALSFAPVTQNLTTSSRPSSSVVVPSLPATHSVSASSMPSICPTTPTNYTSMPAYFGFNIVNSKPDNPNGPIGYKGERDWDEAVDLIKQTFPNVNAFRIYSTTDGAGQGITPHLARALPAARRYNMSILVGVWSGGLYHTDRFEQELRYLQEAVKQHGCDNIAAVSTGNEDLNDINKLGKDKAATDALKQSTADLLLNQMNRVRAVLRQNGCCDVPVTHTDTWNELFNVDSAWVGKLIKGCDQAIIANIFPYWGNVTQADSWSTAAWQANLTMQAAKLYGKDLWLGETGWPLTQAAPPFGQNKYGTSPTQAQDYFQVFGCQILSGSGTAFYYVDWDEDAPKVGSPSFGLWDYNGQPKISLNCSGFKTDMRVTKDLPAFLGGGGIRA